MDFIQNLKLDQLNVRAESDEEVPSYTLSSLVERKPIGANLRHLESESQRPSTTTRQHSLPSLTSSTSSGMSYARSESDGWLGQETRKRRRLSLEDDSSSVLTPLYQAVSAGAPLDVIQSLVRTDPSSTGRRNGGGFTPLHCAIECYDTPVAVLVFLLESDPSTAGQKCYRGLTPVDLLWKRYVEPDLYRSDEVKRQASNLRQTMEQAVSLETGEPLQDAEDGQRNSITSRRQAQANLYLQDRPELRSFWEIMTRFICAACHGANATSAGTRMRLVRDAVEIGCPSLLIRFAAALFPDELLEQQEVSGRVPLHSAAARGSQEILQALLELEPQAVSIRDGNGQLPLHLAIQAHLPWEGALELLVATWPHSLTTVDPTTGLLPAMSASDCSADVIFNLLSANPVEVCRFALERLNI